MKVTLKYSFLARTWLLIMALFICVWSAAQVANRDSSAGVIETVADTTPAEELPTYFDPRTDKGSADTTESRHVPASVMDSLKNDDAFWYANTSMKKKPEREASYNTTPHWVKTLTWVVIVGAFLAALIWYLATSNILIFEKRQKGTETGKDEREIPEDIFSINYQREIDKATGAQDYRLAIRLMFLRLLRNLSNRNLIQYRQGKTNLEYLSQLFSTVYYNDFFRLTRNYEYAWYGKFEVSHDAFKTIRKDFDNFDQQIR